MRRARYIYETVSVICDVAVPCTGEEGRNRYSRPRLFEGKKGPGQTGRSYFAILGLNGSTYCVQNPGDERRLRCGSDLGVGYFPCLEHCKHGDRADAILGRQLGVFIDIELNELDLAGKLGGDFFEAGCNHLARAAPWCPEVNYDRFGRVQNLFLEIGSIDFQSSHCILRPDGQCPVVIGRELFDTLIYVKSVRSLYFVIFPHQATAACLGNRSRSR